MNSQQVEKPVFLEGLRGIASWMVVFHHMSLTFGYDYKRIFNGAPRGFIENTFELFIQFLFNGHFAVMLFFVHSGMVLGFKFFVTHDYNILTLGATKRYFRLIPPATASILLTYAMMKMNLMTSIEKTSEIIGNTE